MEREGERERERRERERERRSHDGYSTVMNKKNQTEHREPWQ